MRRHVVIVLLLVVAVGVLTFAWMARPEPTPAQLYAQAVGRIGTDSPYQGDLDIQITLKPGTAASLVEHFLLDNLQKLELGIHLQKRSGEPEQATLQWQGRSIPLEVEAVAATWWQRFTPNQLLTINHEQCQIAGTLSVSSLLPTTSQDDPVALLLQDLTTGLEQIPATLTLKCERQWLFKTYRVEAIEFSWSQSLSGEQLIRFPFGSQTQSAAFQLHGRFEIIS